eukprot:359111-Chlamydomonas_euryale.AAC.4
MHSPQHAVANPPPSLCARLPLMHAAQKYDIVPVAATPATPGMTTLDRTWHDLSTPDITSTALCPSRKGVALSALCTAPKIWSALSPGSRRSPAVALRDTGVADCGRGRVCVNVCGYKGVREPTKARMREQVRAHEQAR